MARMARVVIPNYPHHVTQRGNRRQKTSARAHLIGEDDELVRVKPMMDRIEDWSGYLSDVDRSDNTDLIKMHTRTGRPLGCVNFIRKLEVISGEKLAPKRPGRKPVNGK